MSICKGCNSIGNLKIKQKDVTHSMFGKNIEIKNVPVLVCNKCDHIEYIYPRELDFQLRDAYRTQKTYITFSI